MEAIDRSKRGYISTRLYGVTQHMKGNFHSQGRDNVILTQIQCGSEIRISSSSWPEWDNYGDEFTVLRKCDTMLEPASEWEGIVISARESVRPSVWMQQSIFCSSQHPSTQRATKYTFISSRDRVRTLPADMILGHRWIKRQKFVTVLGKSVTRCESGNRTFSLGEQFATVDIQTREVAAKNPMFKLNNSIFSQRICL